MKLLLTMTMLALAAEQTPALPPSSLNLRVSDIIRQSSSKSNLAGVQVLAHDGTKWHPATNVVNFSNGVAHRSHQRIFCIVRGPEQSSC